MRQKSRDGFRVAIICALPIEADAVIGLFDEIYDRRGDLYGKQFMDANAYTAGRIDAHNVVLCYMPEIGKVSAASAASSLKFSYSGIKLALVVGICGGVPLLPLSNTPIYLGDVILSDAVIRYDYGSQYPDEFERKKRVTSTLGRPGREMRTFFTQLRTSMIYSDFQDDISQHLEELQRAEPKWQYPGTAHDVLFEGSYCHKHHQQVGECLCFDSRNPGRICDEARESDCASLKCDEGRICRQRPDTSIPKASIHIGTIASGDTVMKSGEHRDKLARVDKVAGFDMEGAGVWDEFPCIVIKGVSDYADSHKNKK